MPRNEPVVSCGTCMACRMGLDRGGFLCERPTKALKAAHAKTKSPAFAPPPAMPEHNGVKLGERSPLLTKGGRKRYLGPSEHDIQALYIQAIQRKANAVPDLATLYAIPNGASASGMAAAARRKAEGQLPAIPDVHWPVARGPFIGLYIEFKRPGEKPTKDQLAMHERLRSQGHAVLVFDDAQRALNATLAYEALGLNRPSVRPVQGQWPTGTKLDTVIAQWRTAAHTLLQDP